MGRRRHLQIESIYAIFAIMRISSGSHFGKQYGTRLGIFDSRSLGCPRNCMRRATVRQCHWETGKAEHKQRLASQETCHYQRYLTTVRGVLVGRIPRYRWRANLCNHKEHHSVMGSSSANTERIFFSCLKRQVGCFRSCRLKQAVLRLCETNISFTKRRCNAEFSQVNFQVTY